MPMSEQVMVNGSLPAAESYYFCSQTYHMETTHPEGRAKRPVFLTVLCILTFVMCGLSFIGWISNAVGGKLSGDEIEDATASLYEFANLSREQGIAWAADFYEKTAKMMVYTNDAHYLMLFMNFLTLALGLGGAILMWKGRKTGFHAYILYNLVGILSVYVAVPVAEVSSFMVIVQVIFSAAFIFMYSRNLYWLK
jgi:hypothetical protein